MGRLQRYRRRKHQEERDGREREEKKKDKRQRRRMKVLTPRAKLTLRDWIPRLGNFWRFRRCRCRVFMVLLLSDHRLMSFFPPPLLASCFASRVKYHCFKIHKTLSFVITNCRFLFHFLETKLFFIQYTPFSNV